MSGGKVVITGAAGLVGQNLIAHLRDQGVEDLVAIDKHQANLRILRELHPELTVIDADLAEPGSWESSVDDADTLIIGHAQIGGLREEEFSRNNVTATERLLERATRKPDRYLIHMSSSVVNSQAVDWYTESKKAQEKLVHETGNPLIVLRPTLMFGWFDRKHLGWLSRFMKRAPFFPIPGHGRYLRQPLYAGDFCAIIAACLKHRREGEAHNISGLEKIDYIDLIRLVRDASGAKTPIVRVPYHAFGLALRGYALFDKDPPFTVKQLEALVTPDLFEVIDWPSIFGIKATPLKEAMRQTFGDRRYSSIALEF